MSRNGAGVSEHGGKVRVSFTFQGQRCRETLDLKWSAANRKAAIHDLATIRDQIANGTFDYAKWFPSSRKVKTGKVPRGTGARALSLSQSIKDFLATKARMSKNTQKLYRNAGEVWKTIFGAETMLGELTHTVVETTIGTHPFASSKLRNDYLIVLRGAFNLAHKTDKSWPNPIEDVENEKRAEPVPNPVDHLQLQRILGFMYTEYNTRHTFASLRLSMGADVYYVSKQLGHKSIQTTMKTYALYIDDAKKEADRVRGLMTALRAKAVKELGVGG